MSVSCNTGTKAHTVHTNTVMYGTRRDTCIYTMQAPHAMSRRSLPAPVLDSPWSWVVLIRAVDELVRGVNLPYLKD